jgi:hypothetical protein
MMATKNREIKGWRPEIYLFGSDNEYLEYYYSHGNKRSIEMAYKVRFETAQIINKMMRD